MRAVAACPAKNLVAWATGHRKVSLWDIRKHGGISSDMRVPFIAGIVVRGIVGAIVIAFFLQYLRRNTLKPFVYYRIFFGIIVIALAYLFRFSAE